MSDDTAIEWTRVPRPDGTGHKRGATWNVVTGCTKVSQGCKHCYAERQWPRFAANPTTTKYYGRPFSDVRCHEELLDQPLRWGAPRGVFVNAMGDLFHPVVPFAFIDRVFAVMALSPRHTFQILTKHALRMHEYMVGLLGDYERAREAFHSLGTLADPLILEGMRRWRAIGATHSQFGESGPLPNVWLGVSTEDQTRADERIPLLLATPAAVRWISAEPLLGAIDLSPYLVGRETHGTPLTGASTVGGCIGYTPPLDWVVVGGESGPKARPMNPRWVREARDQCLAADVAFFFKQWGEWLAGRVHPDPAFTGGAYVDTETTGIGRVAIRDARDWKDGWASVRAGKPKAGRVLDGRTWEQWPSVTRETA